MHSLSSLCPFPSSLSLLLILDYNRIFSLSPPKFLQQCRVLRPKPELSWVSRLAPLFSPQAARQILGAGRTPRLTW